MMSESFVNEQFASGQLSKAESEAEEAVYKSAEPRPEYKEGKERLNFGYVFSNGDVFSATENTDGIAQIVIRRNSETIIDFQEFLPNHKFVTPSYLKQSQVKGAEKVAGEWQNNEPYFLISVGDIRDPKHIFFLLHEIGEAQGYMSGKRKGTFTREEWAENTNLFSQKNRGNRRVIAQEMSNIERDASANALKMVRQIRQDTGLNILEGFKDFDELQNYIYGALISYRANIGQQMIRSDRGLIRNIRDQIKTKLFGTNPDNSEQWRYMRSLFDKGKFGREVAFGNQELKSNEK